MRTFLRGKVTLLFMMLGMLLAIPAVALAAELVTAEVDVGTPATPNEISVEQGGSKALPISLTATGPISCAITSTNPAQAKVFKTYSFTKNATTNAVELSSTDLSDPVNFYSNGIASGGPNCGTTWDTNNVVNATVSAAANVPTGTYTIALVDTNDPASVVPTNEIPSDTAVSNPSASGGKLGDTTKTSIKVNVVPPSNTKPTKPGTPSGTTPNKGAFTLNWAASTDDHNPNPPDAVTYRLEHKDANDASYSLVPGAGSLSTNSYTFGGTNAVEDEGTWTYRVQASDSALTSDFSDESSPGIVVDRSAPSAPTATTNPLAAAYTTSGGLKWFKDSVKVSYGGSTDQALPDGSPGSGTGTGNITYTAEQTLSTAGENTYSGTATDKAGNVSTATTDKLYVDTENPTVSFTDCPTGSVVQNSDVTVHWTASDPGASADPVTGSGLTSSSPTSGSVTLTTGTIGSKTATVATGTAQDNVGHTSAEATCNYKVIFNWDGFFSPIDNLDPDGHYVLNSAKAGSAIPVKFSLKGDQGLNIFATATDGTKYPKSSVISCDPTADVDAIESTVTAGQSSLQYDSTLDQYTYVWKTDKGWAGTCRQLEVKLTDGTSHKASFKLLK